MGLDLDFVNPLSYSPIDDEFKEGIALALRHACLRLIDWLPYTAESQLLVHPKGVHVMDSHSSIGVYDKSAPHGSSLCGNCLYPNIKVNANKTVKEFKEWLYGLLTWIQENKVKYTYLSKPKYKWQEQFFTKDNNKHIMFGDIISINSETEPPKYKPGSNNPKPYYLKHHIYWTDKRQPEYICMETDAILIQQFIDELNDMDIPDEWILYMH